MNNDPILKRQAALISKTSHSTSNQSYPANLYGTSFQEAFNDYRNQLSTKPKKKQFIGDIELSNGNASADELQEAVEALVRQCENKKLRQFWRKYLTPVVNGLDELSGVIGGTGTAFYVFFKGRSLNQALVQAVSNVPQAMPLAIVWGGLKFMMGVSGGLESLHRSILSEIT